MIKFKKEINKLKEGYLNDFKKMDKSIETINKNLRIKGGKYLIASEL